MKRRYTAAAAMMMVMGLCASASAAATVDKTLDNYTLDGVIVEADAVRNQFGDINTEQSYYRTGGDVNVITSQTLEKRHYQQLGDALKTIPGVQVQSPGGYRGGEYGYTQTHTIVSINGDARVVVLIDGRTSSG